MTELLAVERVIPMTLADLDTVDLDELNAQAALMTRVDRKYVATRDQLARVVSGLDPRTRLLQIAGRTEFAYESVYFDTDDLDSFRSTALRRRRRFKVRTRTYVDSGECWLEVKTRGPRKSTVKNRIPHENGEAHFLRETAAAFVDDTLADARVPSVTAARLRPIIVTGFRRRTLWLPDDGARVTIDDELTVSADRRRAGYPDAVIVETKSGGVPSEVDRLLWAAGVRPARMSKFGVGMAVLDPRLPANRWHRVMSQHFPHDDFPHDGWSTP